MYLHLGEDYMVPSHEVIGVFDLDTTTVTQNTRDFLAQSEQNGAVVNTSYQLPKSFVVTGNAEESHVYISQLNSETLKKRIQFPHL